MTWPASVVHRCQGQQSQHRIVAVMVLELELGQVAAAVLKVEAEHRSLLLEASDGQLLSWVVDRSGFERSFVQGENPSWVDVGSLVEVAVLDHTGLQLRPNLA
jgi:hypothetical protein